MFTRSIARRNGDTIPRGASQLALSEYAKGNSWPNILERVNSEYNLQLDIPSVKSEMFEYISEPNNLQDLRSAIWWDHTQGGLPTFEIARKYNIGSPQVFSALTAESLAQKGCKYFWRWTPKAVRTAENLANMGIAPTKCVCGASPDHMVVKAPATPVYDQKATKLEAMAESGDEALQVQVLEEVTDLAPSDQSDAIAEAVVDELLVTPKMTKSNIKKYVVDGKMHIIDAARDVFKVPVQHLANTMDIYGYGSLVSYARGRKGLVLPREAVVEILADGGTFEELVEEFFTSKGPMKRYLEKEGLLDQAQRNSKTSSNKKRQGYTDADILSLAREGRSLETIATLTGFDLARVTRVVGNSNIPQSNIVRTAEDEARNKLQEALYDRSDRLAAEKEKYSRYRNTVETLFLARKTPNEIAAHLRTLASDPVELPHYVLKAFISDAFRDVHRLRNMRVPVATITQDFNIDIDTYYYIVDYFDKALGRRNPADRSGSNHVLNGASMAVGGVTAMGIAKYLDAKHPSMSTTKKSVISGAVPASVGLGVYAYSKNEAALYGAAGSVVGALISAYLFKK